MTVSSDPLRDTGSKSSWELWGPGLIPIKAEPGDPILYIGLNDEGLTFPMLVALCKDLFDSQIIIARHAALIDHDDGKERQL